jgi:hypothetical protein
MLAEQAWILGWAILADDNADMPVKPGSLPGDPQRLRGIPSIGGRGGVGGAITGSRPGDGLTGRRGDEILRGFRRRAHARGREPSGSGSGSGEDSRETR